MNETAKVRKIAFVGDHPPRKCGIATFTSDLLTAVANVHPQSHCFAVSVNDIKGGYEYPEVVRFEIEEQDLSSYLRAADFLNINNVDIVCLQHEFGIFGGHAGGHILAFLRELRMPVVTTLHTVLREPRADQERVMQELISLSTRLVVMTERGRRILQDVYAAPPVKIDLIAHGIPDVAFVDPSDFKDQVGVEGKLVLLTFGLLSPNKGIEYVLNGLPSVLAEFPDVVYIVLGATHPNELREHGEVYRLSLEILAKKNKVEKNVIFYNRFVDLARHRSLQRALVLALPLAALLTGAAPTAVSAQLDLEEIVELVRKAWLRHDYEELLASSDTVRLQFPEIGRQQGVPPAHAARVLREYLSSADEVSFELHQILTASEDHRYAQLVRKYVVRRTTDERVETVFLGFRRVAGRWRLREVRVTS